MALSSSYASEALIGPPSEPIYIRDFITRCSNSPATTGYNETSSNNISGQTKQEIEEECSLDDLESSLNETLSNPSHYSFLVNNHEDNIEAVCAASKASGQPSRSSKTRKRKRADQSNVNEVQLAPETIRLRDALKNTVLTSWAYSTDAAYFIRSQKNSDLNTLTKPKISNSTQPQSLQPEAGEEAVLIVSVYNRLSWGNHLSRSSQHAVLSSQTIGDLYEVIPCSSNELPSEITEEDEVIGYNIGEISLHRGAVVCIEDVAYGDGQSEEDYSEKLIQQLELLPKKKRPKITKGTGMHDQRFADLTVRLNQAYWLLHQGTCEHFLVIDSIRMLHSNDPTGGYPLTLHIAPPLLDLCMACSRVSAALSVAGDVRLGQSPFKICRPCWTLFGEPDAQEKVVVVPLPRYEHGW